MGWIELVLVLVVVWTFITLDRLVGRCVESVEHAVVKLDQIRASVDTASFRSQTTQVPGGRVVTEAVAHEGDSVYTEATAYDDLTRWKVQQIERGVVTEGTTDANVCGAWDDEDFRLWQQEQEEAKLNDRLIDDQAQNRGLRWQ